MKTEKEILAVLEAYHNLQDDAWELFEKIIKIEKRAKLRKGGHFDEQDEAQFSFCGDLIVCMSADEYIMTIPVSLLWSENLKEEHLKWKGRGLELI